MAHVVTHLDFRPTIIREIAKMQSLLQCCDFFGIVAICFGGQAQFENPPYLKERVSFANWILTSTRCILNGHCT